MDEKILTVSETKMNWGVDPERKKNGGGGKVLTFWSVAMKMAWGLKQFYVTLSQGLAEGAAFGLWSFISCRGDDLSLIFPHPSFLLSSKIWWSSVTDLRDNISLKANILSSLSWCKSNIITWFIVKTGFVFFLMPRFLLSFCVLLMCNISVVCTSVKSHGLAGCTELMRIMSKQLLVTWPYL